MHASVELERGKVWDSDSDLPNASKMFVGTVLVLDGLRVRDMPVMGRTTNRASHRLEEVLSGERQRIGAKKVVGRQRLVQHEIKISSMIACN